MLVVHYAPPPEAHIPHADRVALYVELSESVEESRATGNPLVFVGAGELRTWETRLRTKRRLRFGR